MIKILLFAHLQEEAKCSQLELEINDITVKELKDKLKNEFKFTQLDQAMVAINEEYAVNDDNIKDGDVVALIPPVSGG